jgi:hypothetical protein
MQNPIINDLYMVTIVLVKSVFVCRDEDFKMEQGSTNKFLVKLNKAAIETFEILKSVYSEELLYGRIVFEWHKRFKEAIKN